VVGTGDPRAARLRRAGDGVDRLPLGVAGLGVEQAEIH
jgi:hypothetical protein